MKYLILPFIFFLSIQVQAIDKQFPTPGHVYVPGRDTGFNQYLAKSLHGTHKIALTFDDGPHVTNTPIVLDILKKFKVKATFFILTERINASTLPIIYRMMAEGHNIASHHENHLDNNTKNEEVFRAELGRSVTDIATLMDEQNAPHREIYYRFPYGAYGSKKLAYHHLNVMKDVSRNLFGNNCINFVFWDIDSVDWLTLTPDEISQNVMANIFGGTAYDFDKDSNGAYVKKKITITDPPGGGVMLIHDIHSRSVAALPRLLQKFIDKRVKVVPLQEVKEYAFNGKECRLRN